MDKNNDNFNYYILYKGEGIKGTNIKNGKGIEYKINDDNIIFKGEYLNGEKFIGNGKEYYYDGKFNFEVNI